MNSHQKGNAAPARTAFKGASTGHRITRQFQAVDRWLKTWHCVPGWEQRGAFWLEQLNRTHNAKFLRAFCANSDGAMARLREARERGGG
jgi:hypothetical protein